MAKWFIPLLLILCPLVGYSQFGVNVKYLFGQSEILDEVNLNQDGMQASLEYGFRLKQKRIEFHPALGYRFTWHNSSYDGYFRSLDLDLNTAIYPFDFAGDCHCPTFSKDGELFKKGFFLEVSPGVSYQTLHRYRADGILREPVSNSEVILKISGAVGLDIGINEQITITPMVSYTLLAPSDWGGLNTDGTIGNLDDYKMLGTGLRISYKPDPKRRRRF
jgi:hypothetical protein